MKFTLRNLRHLLGRLTSKGSLPGGIDVFHSRLVTAASAKCPPEHLGSGPAASVSEADVKVALNLENGTIAVLLSNEEKADFSRQGAGHH